MPPAKRVVMTLLPEKGALNLWKACTIALVHMSTINPTPEIRKSHRQINFFKTGSICIIQHDGISRQADG